jgi:hypothetical protein
MDRATHLLLVARGRRGLTRESSGMA